MANIAKVGDPTSHGGVIITGDPTMTIDGRPVACIGDLQACPQIYPWLAPHAVNPIIVPAAPVVARPTVNGKPVACLGDMTQCGAVILPPSPNATAS